MIEELQSLVNKEVQIASALEPSAERLCRLTERR